MRDGRDGVPGRSSQNVLEAQSPGCVPGSCLGQIRLSGERVLDNDGPGNHSEGPGGTMEGREAGERHPPCVSCSTFRCCVKNGQKGVRRKRG